MTQETADDLRVAVAATGVDAASSPVVTTSGDNAILVQTEPLGSGESDQIVAAIVDETGADAEADLSQEEIGASWGQEVAERSLRASASSWCSSSSSSGRTSGNGRCRSPRSPRSPTTW